MKNIETLRENIRPLAERYRLKMVVLFGSSADGSVHSESDADVAYMAEGEGLSARAEAELITELMRVFGTERVDLASLHRAHPLLMKRVASEGILLYENAPSVFNEYYCYALKRYAEAKELFDMEAAYVRRVVSGE